MNGRRGRGAARGASAGATPARRVAVTVGRLVRERDAYAQEMLHAQFQRVRLSPEDRAFATLLAEGVVATQGSLDDLIDRSLRSPDDVQPDVRDALRVSAYELLFLKKEPYAVVDQGVELVRFVQPRAAGLGNAALRSMARLARDFPFGDPKSDIAASARANGFPLWMAKMLAVELGDIAARAFMQTSNEPAPLFVTPNARKSRPGEIEAELKRAKGTLRQVEVGGGPLECCYELSPARILTDGRVAHLLNLGRLLISDASSQYVAAAALPDGPDGSLLEVGAGRGTKTVLIESAAVRRWGKPLQRHVALDSHRFKTDLLLERARTCGFDGVEAVVGNAMNLSSVLNGRKFDKVFIDAPCSGLGTLRRHPEIRWRLASSHIDELARVQRAMLASAASAVKPGGEILYATCTVTRKENIDVVKGFLDSKAGKNFALAPLGEGSCFSPALEPGGPDAHFAARFKRID